MKYSLFIALKGLKKYKVNLVINLIGMTFGIGAVMVISAFVISEWNIGKELQDRNIYRVEIESTLGNFSTVNYPTAGYLVENLPSVINASVFVKREVEVDYKNQQFDFKQTIFSDSSFFEIYKNVVISGNLEHYKTTPYAVVLTKSISDKLFGDENPIGKTFEIVQFGTSDVTVVAVIEDVPTGHINEFELVANVSWILSEKDLTNWANFGMLCLLELEHGTTPTDVATFLDQKTEQMNPYMVSEYKLKTKLVAYEDIYFNAPGLYDPFKQGNKMFVVFFISVALFMLIIVIINSVNLTRAQWMNRINEICVRKSNGASRANLFSQFIAETVILNTGSFILAVSIIILVFPHIPELNPLLGFLYTPVFISTMLLCYIVIGTVVGSVASIRLTNIKIAKGFAGKALNKRKTFSSKMALICFQFLVSIVMITTIIGVYKQMNYMAGKDIGFKKENLVEFAIPNFYEYNILRNKILKHSSIENVSLNNRVINPALNLSTYEFIYDGKKKIETPPSFNADLYFADIMGFEIIQGRIFNEKDKNNTCLINQAAAKAYDIEDIDKGFFINEKQVIGIIKNYNFASLHQNIEPLVIFGEETPSTTSNGFNSCVVKINSSDPAVIKDALAYINASWKELSGGTDAEIRFVDDIINRMYAKETSFQKVLNTFTFLIVLIVIMGLFGVSLNIVSKKIKEIGVRKVHGASVFGVVKMLNISFLKWILVAYALSMPITFFVINKWLQNFAYKTELSWWVFALAGILALGIALLTVSWQSWRAARRNPVEALRYE